MNTKFISTLVAQHQELKALVDGMSETQLRGCTPRAIAFGYVARTSGEDNVALSDLIDDEEQLREIVNATLNQIGFGDARTVVKGLRSLKDLL